MRRQSALILALLLSIASTAACRGMGFTGDAFGLGASARGLGLGGAFSALVDDETAALHNPAALGNLTSTGISSMVARQFGGTTVGSVSLAMPWIGINVSFLDSGLISSPQGAFRYATQAIAVSGGIPIGLVGIGCRWRYVNVSSPSSGSGWTIDPALLIDAGSLRVAALFESAFSSPMLYVSGVEEAFEPSLRLGIAATLSPSPDVWWNASFEASGLFSSKASYSAGLEAWIGGLGARVGYDGTGPTFGLTIRITGVQLDWAYAMRSDLGNSHRVSLTFRIQRGAS
ncbi:hypothetical protein IH601_10790 [Candidatus Bipolaricaulota bacterium]|jgi:hypothetical protein|nr:hypothetical protein [Candidatus Bipolaricaulota bacterium]TFH08501.1 MAG: hypothetical protein E4H08_07665 [Candidatus Atribacteria bacterium]